MRNGGAPLTPPRYLHLDLPMHAMRNVSRFRLRAHTLAVESSIWCGGNGHCDKCSCAAVQNEVNVLFHCQDLFVCSLKRKHSFLLFPFCQSFPIEAPYVPHALPTRLVVRLSSISFLNGIIYSVPHFHPQCSCKPSPLPLCSAAFRGD